MSALSRGLLDAFATWIRQIAIPRPESLTVAKARIDLSARFISFNYTDTLQQLYGVPPDNVWHIHGAADGNGGLTLGHGWQPKPAESYAARIDPERDDTRIIDGAYVIDRYFKESFKPTEKIMADGGHRFDALSDVDELRVLGHSLSDVDLPYLRKIADSVTPEARWRISYHGTASPVQEQFAKFGELARATFLPLGSV